jgi:phenylacetate-CoA ligase
MLIIRGVNVFPSQVEELILAERRLGPHYCLEITREGHLDALAVQVEMQAGAEATPGDCEAVSRSLAHRLKSYVGISARVVVNPAGTIERSIGKARRVIDKRAR